MRCHKYSYKVVHNLSSFVYKVERMCVSNNVNRKDSFTVN